MELFVFYYDKYDRHDIILYHVIIRCQFFYTQDDVIAFSNLMQV